MSGKSSFSFFQVQSFYMKLAAPNLQPSVSRRISFSSKDTTSFTPVTNASFLLSSVSLWDVFTDFSSKSLSPEYVGSMIIYVLPGENMPYPRRAF